MSFSTEGEYSQPQYVVRDGDFALNAAISSGGFVVLHGRAASGKTRSAYEAIKQMRGDSQMLVPAYPLALRELLEAGYEIADSVIWLDDLEQYLTPGGIDAGLLEMLCPPGRHDVVIVSTIRDEELARWRHGSLSGQGTDDLAADREARTISYFISRLPQDRLISVGQYLTDQERMPLAKGHVDARVMAALETGEGPEDAVGFAEFLAAGPTLMDRWSVGDGPLFDVGQALLSAAVDCRRAGFSRPIPREILALTYRQYLSPARRDRADLPSVEEGLTWACQPVLGASSCLSPRRGSRYLALDYLLDRAQAGQGPLAKSAVPDEIWNTLLNFADRQEIASVGVSAIWAERKDVAEAAFRLASDAGEAGGIMNLGPLFAEQGRTEEAEEHWLRAAEAGWFDAMYEVGVIRENNGDFKEAKIWYQQAAEGDDPRAMNALGILTEAEGEFETAAQWYRKAADVDDIIFIKHTDAMRNLSSLLRKQGKLAEAEIWNHKAIELDEERTGPPP